jgi:hypothetical protein
VLYTEDGPGIIRIGATGPILTMSAPYKEGQNWGQGGFFESEDGPDSGADLLEISQGSITGMASIWRVKTGYLKVSTRSMLPVSYRISFVSELPANRVGGVYDAGVAAQTYVFAVANGNTSDLYQTTRIHYSAEEATDLREKLFSTKEKILSSWSIHSPSDAIEANARGRLHVQRIILSTGGKNWAFRIICEKVGGFWLVAEASRDPELSYKQVADIVDRDFQKNKRMVR